MLRRGRAADLRRRRVRRQHPAEARGRGVEQGLKAPRPVRWADTLRSRMRRGIRRLGRMLERI